MNFSGIRKFGWPRLEIYRAGDLTLTRGQACVIESEHGLDYGEVIYPTLPDSWSGKCGKARKILRVANGKDLKHFRRKLLLERKAFEFCLKKNGELNVPMKLVTVLYAMDFKRATFYYTAAGRIDFRQLVKDLAKGLHIRVEMRQIGVRDEARMLPGSGTCGRTLCCSTFLKDFSPVSMKMAKEQNLVLNPSKVSGVCGRLKCCLAFEYYPGNKKKAACIYKYDDVN